MNLIIELAEEAAKEPWELKKLIHLKKMSLVSKKFKDIISSAYTIKDKKNRQEKLKEISNSSLESLSEESDIELKKLSNSMAKLQKI